jgi:hypothetical protein
MPLLSLRGHFPLYRPAGNELAAAATSTTIARVLSEPRADNRRAALNGALLDRDPGAMGPFRPRSGTALIQAPVAADE